MSPRGPTRSRHGGATRTAVLGALVLTAAIPGAGSAQAPDSAQRPDTVVPLPPILVAHYPLPLPAFLAPAAITRLDSAALRGHPGSSLAGVLAGAPGVQVDDRHNDALDERIAIRGFGARAQFGVRGLAVVVDGIPATMPDGQTALSHLDPAAPTSVEIVRGPASAFVGNAGGGAMRVETTPRRAGAGGRVLAGSDGFLRLEATAARRVGGSLVSGRLARRRTDGYRAHAGADRTWASGHLDAPVAGGRLRADIHGVTYEADNPGSLTDSALFADPRAAFARNVDQGTGEEARQAQAGIGWVGPAAGGVWEALAWTLRREVDNPIPVAIVNLDRTAAGMRLRHRREAGPWSVAVGLDAGAQWDDRVNDENLGGTAGQRLLDQQERVTSLAPLAQASLRVGDVRVIAGARWDRTAFRIRDRLDAQVGVAGRTLSAFSPSAGVAWSVGDAVWFANISTAFETPTASEFANDPDGGGFNASLEPQRTLGQELGVRGRSGRSRLEWEVVAHHARVEDALIPFEGEEGRTFFRNAGRTRHAGLETVLASTPLRWAGARVMWSWTAVTFRSFRTETGDLRGNDVPGVAPHRVSLSGWVRGADATLAVEAVHRGRAPADDANSAHWPAHTVLDLRAEGPGFAVGDTRLRAQAGVRNVTDEVYAGSIVPNAFGRRYFEPAPGRTWYVGLAFGSVD